MLKDYIAITLIAWLIELTGKAILGVARAIRATVSYLTNQIFNLVKENITEEGVVTRTIDGDSIIVKTEKGEKEVRIKGIDAPEYGQGGFLDAKKKVQKLTLGQTVTLRNSETDKYGRTASKVEINHSGQCVAEELASSGVAFPDPRGTTKEIKKLANKAQEKSLGVWKRKEKTPWEFRDMM
jgi:endonuclease YncB( thermonuclease family)